MKRILVAIVVSLLLASLVAPFAVIHAQSRSRRRGRKARPPRAAQAVPAPPAVALLTQPEGNVRLKRGGRTQRIKEDMLLNLGDAVSVKGSGTAVVYQAYLPVKRLGANERFDVVLRSPPPPARALSPEEFIVFKTHYSAARQNRRKPSPATMGGPEDANLTLLEPRNSVVMSRRPTFIWTRVAEATKYVVNVYDKNDAVVCAESVSETRLTLPDRCKPLDPKDYKWDVTAQIGNQVSDNTALYDATSFTVVTDQRAAEISEALEHAQAVAAGSGEALSVYVSALMEFKLYPQAEVESRRALKQSPKDQILWALLMETYAQMKRWPAREKAREISDGNPTAELVHALEVRQ